MVLVYHNITPPEYFIGIHKDLVKLCFRGRRELTAYIDRCELALGDSEYNRRELEATRLPSNRGPPRRPRFQPPGLPARSQTRAVFDDEWTNVMFVGRVIPNKKFEDVIRAFHAYRTRHNPRSRLLLVGSYSGFEKYLAMLQGLIARLGTPDVHFLGHVSNEELTALYDVADLFLCASEHEGFCVPIVEAFYKRVPVLAYAATAVPATMDGGGVLYDTKDPLEIARLMDAVLDDADIEDAVVHRRTRRSAAPRQGFRRDAAALRRPDAGDAAARSTRSRLGFLAAVRSVRAARGAAAVPAGAVSGAAGDPRLADSAIRRLGRRLEPTHDSPDRASQPAAKPPARARAAIMIINQWVPAAHSGDAIGDSARRVRGMLRAAGHTSDLYALTMDDGLRGDVRPFEDPEARRGDVTIFHFALPSPMTRAFASLGGARVLQYHNITPAAFFAPYDAGLFRLAALGRQELRSLAGHVDLALGDSEFNRQELEELGFAPTGVMPIAVNIERITARATASRARKDPRRRPDQHPLRRPHRPQQADRGPYPPGGGLQAVRRQLLSVHLRRPLRRPATVLRADPGADRGVPDAAGSVLVHGPGSGRGSCAFYRWADVYVSLSEHEGFCVPLVEAMAADVPVLAYAAGAVPETLGGAGVLFTPKDLEFAAEMLGTLVYDRPVRDRVIDGQRRRLHGLRARPRYERRLVEIAVRTFEDH